MLKAKNKAMIIFTINDWQDFIIHVVNPFGFYHEEMIVRPLKLVDIIDTKPFKIFIDKLARGEYPQGTVFTFTLKNTKEGIIMTNINAVIDKKSKEEIGTETIIKHGLKLEFSERNIHIEILSLSKCPECGTEFTQSRKDQVYCSTSCGAVVRVREFRKRKKELAENKI